jgi:hypothetical protein
MIWFFAASSLMIVIGAAFSVLRNPQTLDYCRTLINDGRKDDRARVTIALYKAGLTVLLLGTVLLLSTIGYAVVK